MLRIQYPASMFARDALDAMSTREELAYMLKCVDDDSTGFTLNGLRVLDGSEHLVQALRYCGIVHLILRLLESYGMHTSIPPSGENLITFYTAKSPIAGQGWFNSVEAVP